MNTGSITGVQANVVTVSGAGWTNGLLSTASSPHFLRFNSGAASGRSFLISANTADQLTISSADGFSSTTVNLLTIGVNVGDQFSIIEGDTILSLFGHGTVSGVDSVKGGVSPNGSDTLQINSNNSFATYYYDTTQGAWVNVATEALANNVLVRPDSVVIFNRIAATPLSVTMVGDVPVQNRRFVVREGQITALSTHWPVNVTLGSLNLQQVPSWVSSANPSIADIVQLRIGSSWRSYYHDGVNWIDLASEAVSNGASVSAGSGILIRKRSISSNGVVVVSAPPYTL
jgi:uncharacterized protein (TIGR02597 family)